MVVLGLDPGWEQSALVGWDGNQVTMHHTMPNDVLLNELRGVDGMNRASILAIEQIEAMGMAVGKTVFETVYWSGRFAEAYHPGRVVRVTRHEVKLHICGQRRAKDSEIRQALIDRFGPSKEKAIGKAKTPGPLFKVVAHELAALAVALTWHDQHSGEIRPGVTPHF